MKQSLFTLKQTRRLAKDTFALTLLGDTSAITAPGQFVNIKLPDRFLRRPVSVCDWTEDSLVLLVKAVGGGTQELVGFPSGTELDLLTGLGNGFDPDQGGVNPILAGGGIGIAPLYGLARRLLERGKRPTMALGFRSKQDALYVEEFTALLGTPPFIATEDGSLGIQGFVSDCLKNAPPHYVFACGPLPMLKAVCGLACLEDGQFSFEARMGCGFGACMGCTVPTKGGYKRVCKDGPVLYKEEIIWQT